METIRPQRITLLFAIFMALVFPGSSVADVGSEPRFAAVNGEILLTRSYVQSLRNAAKRRFYHGEAPEDQLRLFKWEVGQELINQRLFLQEAEKRGIAADGERIERELTRLVERYRKNPKWKEQKDVVITDLQRRLTDKNRIDQLETQVKSVGEPSTKQLQAFYKNNSEMFTSPEQIHVSMILLKVDPWLPSEDWRERLEEANALVEQIREKADFYRLAKMHSQDKSAEKGGDLGYQHRGMLGETAEKILDELKPGEVSDAVQVLEGIAIFRLEERRRAILNPLSIVQNRAKQLWKRDAREKAMSTLLNRLKRSARIELLDPVYRKLDEETRKENAGALMVSGPHEVSG